MSSIVKRRSRKLDPNQPLDDNSTLENPSSPVSQAGPYSSFMNHPLTPKHKRVYTSRLFSSVIIAIVTTLFGWNAHSFFITSSCHNSKALPAHEVKTPPWWLEDEVDDFFERIYVPDLPTVRELNTSSFFTGMCGRYRFDDTAFPTISVIVTMQNEQAGMITLTVQALLARTAPSMLVQIIIVDDNGLGDIRGPVNETELQQLRASSSKILFVTNEQREGVARSRMRGSRVAIGDVLMFVDSHVEMLSSTWAQHLLLPIIENPYTLAAQTLDIISDLDWQYGPGGGDLLYGVINDDFWFSYQRSRFAGPSGKGAEGETPSRRVPYETPFSAGSLFAVRRDVFEKFGGYDEGMYVWGGENTDFAIKMWACGGRVVMVPCSRVGHMYRIHIKDTGRWPPHIPQALTDKLNLSDEDSKFEVRGSEADNFTKIITRNNIRVLERWAKTSNARTGYYMRTFNNATLPEEWKHFADEMKTDPYALAQEKFIRENGCKNFDWFDRHVYIKLTGVHHPWHPDSPGRTWV